MKIEASPIESICWGRVGFIAAVVVFWALVIRALVVG